MPTLHMRDFLTITKSDARFPIKIADSKSLFVKAHATHCGTINGNYRFYRPDSMQKATHTWLPFGAPKRPVIINHKEDSEVLGRVVEAKYVDESYKWATDYPTIKDSLFYKTDGRRNGLFESVDWIVDNLIDAKGYTGLGYIELGLNITNPDAIEKVLRDEYLTVSVGFTTDSAICSICHQDWAADDRCDHTLGEMVDKKKMFLICAPKAYDEVSFVTFPADPFASVFSKEQLKDNLQKFSYLGLPISTRKTDSTLNSLTDSLFTYDITHAEENMNNFTQLLADKKYDEVVTAMKADSLTVEIATEIKSSLQDWSPATEEEKTKKRSLQSTLTSQIRKKNLDSKPVEEVVDNVEILSAIAKAENATELTLTDIEEADREYFNDASGISVEMGVILAKNGVSAETIDNTTFANSDYVGPNNTFPVTTLAMAQAAIEVVEASKLTDATKLKLITAINAKKAQIKASMSTEPVSVVSDKIKNFAGEKFTDSGKEILTTFTTLDKAYDAAPEELQQDMRMMLTAMQEDWYADKFVAHMKGVLENRDFAVKSNQDMADMDETINSLSDKVTTLTTAVAGQKTINNALLDTYKRSLATQIVVFKTIKGVEEYKDLNSTERKTKVDELTKRHVEYLKDTVNDILSEVKFDDKASDNTAAELGVQVSDSATIAGGETITTTAMTDTKHVVELPQFLTSSERRMAQLQRAYEASKKS